MNEMNVTHKKLSKDVLRRLGTFVLALCMALSLLPSVLPPADAAFSDAAMDKLLNWGVVNGYPDGALHPDWSLTRAEFVAMVNRAYGYDELGATPFIDVPDNAWFHDDINIAYNARYFTGVSPRMAAPDTKLTREQAVVLLARNMRLEPIDGEAVEFSDGRDFSDWSRGYARAAKEAGVIGGYSDGSYKPKNSITRGEMAVMLQRALGTLINKPGTHTLSDVYGNVTINTPNVLLKDSTIVGDLYITGGLSLGDVTLQNVRVLGKIVVAGGGESESGESVILRNVQADALIVDSIVGQYVSLASEGDTLINEAILRTSAYVQDRTRPGEGLIQITLASLEAAAAFTLSGNLETVVNKTPNSTLKIAMGTVARLTVDEAARSSALNLDINSTVEELNLDTAATVTGVGDIGDLFVNAPGADVEMLPDKVTIRPGLTATVGGQSMNAQQAQESSSDPRLLASYPKVKNIAPTNATSVYSANKGGTVFWAVSDTTDGSIGEEELIEPTDENARIVLSGTTAVEQSNTEYTAALQPLTPDTNYYLSTIMTDARGRRSPIKVASFATPDNTVPAFAPGYPVVMKNYSESIPDEIEVEINGEKVKVQVVKRDEDGYPVRNYRVQIAAMPTKTCVLYYAVYPAGSTAPTAQQFRTGALGTPIRSGMEDATKNRINFIELTNLEELTNYDIYLCYIDADGSRSSAVQKLTFRTVDGKPPRFQFETPVVTQEQLTALTLSVNLNEAATVYWVATRNDKYVTDNANWSDTEWWERACRQIESGTNGIRSGSVNARANTDTRITITGLQPATRYHIFFVAKDAAGNYSEFFRLGNVGDNASIEPPEQYTPHNQQPYKYYLITSTLDNIPPTATQEFTSYDAVDPTRPYADTDILIHFSEAVMSYENNSAVAQEYFASFDKLYASLVDARNKLAAAKVNGTVTDDLRLAVTNAETAFASTLRKTIKLYNNAAATGDVVPDRSLGDDDWVIDYRYARVDYDADTGEMTVVFPTVLDEPEDPDDPNRSALNLASGSTYHFELVDICDTSSSRNRMGRTLLPDFTTISAQVRISAPLGLTTVYYTNYHTDDDTVPYEIEEIPLDMSFYLSPVSTSVEDDVVWDILFWSDTNCEFEVYELDSGSNYANAMAIRPLDDSGNFSAGNKGNGHHSVLIPAVDLGAPNLDEYAEDFKGFIGVSYFADFYDENAAHNRFPGVTGEDAGYRLVRAGADEGVNPRGILKRNQQKYYGIRITKIGNDDEEAGRNKIWDATIHFRVCVVTGSRSSLGNLSALVTNETVTNFDSNPASGSIISTPKSRLLEKVFTNRAAAAFRDGFPTFNPSDTSVSVSFPLDRSGTVHWVIAPASQWTQTGNNLPTKSYSPTLNPTLYNPAGVRIELHAPEDRTSTPEPVQERYYFTFRDITLKDGSKTDYDVYIPSPAPSGSGYNTVPAYDPETKSFDLSVLTSRLEVSNPTSLDIYTRRGLGTNPNIIAGSRDFGVDSSPFTITGLQPETVYFVYLVTQAGTVYSERAQLFQFSTTRAIAPKLTVSGRTKTSVTIESDINAYVETTLFREDMLREDDMFNSIFYAGDGNYEYIDAGRAAEYREEFYGYTVLDAIFDQSKEWGGGCMFDYFANETTKDQVAGRIRAEGTTLGEFLNKNVTGRDPTPFEYNLTSTQRYFVVAVAGASNSTRTPTGHSLGFGGRGDLQNLSEDPPVIVSISGTVTRDYDYAVDHDLRVPYVMYGEVSVTFKDALYLFTPGIDGTRDKRDALTDSNKADFIERSNGGPFTVATLSADRRTVTVKLYGGRGLGGILDGDSFTVTSLICTADGPTRDGAPLTIKIEYDASTDRVYAVIDASNAADWFPPNGARVPLTSPVVRTPRPAEGFHFAVRDLGTITSDSNSYALLEVVMEPAGTEGSVSFSIDPAAAVTINQTAQENVYEVRYRSGYNLPVDGTVVTITGTLAVSGTNRPTDTATVRVEPNLTIELDPPPSGGNATSGGTITIQLRLDNASAQFQEYKLTVRGLSSPSGVAVNVDYPQAASYGTGDAKKFKFSSSSLMLNYNGEVWLYPTADGDYINLLKANPNMDDDVQNMEVTFRVGNARRTVNVRLVKYRATS